MPYLIDGHNLIPHIPGIDLKELDDEMQLVKELQNFSKQVSKRVEVFFDNVPPDRANHSPLNPPNTSPTA